MKGSSANGLGQIDIQNGEILIRKIRNAKCLDVFNVPTYWSGKHRSKVRQN